MHPVVEHSKEEVQKRQGKLLKTLPNATTKLHLKLRGAVACRVEIVCLDWIE